jgi:hypothetical protein
MTGIAIIAAVASWLQAVFGWMVGFALVPFAYGLAWLGGRVLDWWTRPSKQDGR